MSNWKLANKIKDLPKSFIKDKTEFLCIDLDKRKYLAIITKNAGDKYFVVSSSSLCRIEFPFYYKSISLPKKLCK